ncbi:MAG: alpha/beta hydrolase [Ekhidna sp.]
MKVFLFWSTAILLIGSANEAFAIKPDRNYILTPDSVNWPYEQLTITTEDNFKLNTWLYSPNSENDKNTVLILAYPDAGNMSYWVYFAWMLAKSGYTVVTFDYRGFGKSDDFDINPDNLYYTEFSTDLEAVVTAISKKLTNQKLGIWALSMGTTVTSRAHPKIKNDINFIIGEGYVTDTSYIINRYKEKGKNLILPEPAEIYSNIISNINLPTLIFTASEDEITTTEDALELKESLGTNCQVITYDGQHLRGFQYQIDKKGFGGWYIEQIDSFLAKN